MGRVGDGEGRSEIIEGDEGDHEGGGDDDDDDDGDGSEGGSPLPFQQLPSPYFELLLLSIYPLVFPPQPPLADKRDDKEDFERGVDDQSGNEDSGNFFSFFISTKPIKKNYRHIASCNDSLQLLV